MGLVKGAPLKVHGLESETRPGRYRDGPNAYGLSNRIRLREDKSLSKLFYWRGRVRGKNGKKAEDKEYKIGPFPIISLTGAREIAHEYFKSALEGKDPCEETEETKPIQKISEATEIVIGIQNYRPESSKPHEWRTMTEQCVIPVTGDKPMNEFTRADTLSIMTPLWADENDKARTLLARLAKVCDWAVGQGHLDFNPADDAAIAALPPIRHVTVNHAAVDYRDVEDYITEILGLSQFDPAVLEGFAFLILTVGRHREIFDLEWSDLHMDWEVFTPKGKTLRPLKFPCLVIPKERMKTKDRPHVIPLSTQALRILVKALKFRARHPHRIFPTEMGGRNNGMNTKKVRDAIDFAKGTAHGFRASMSTWAQDHGAPDSVAEAALAHKITGVRGAYARSVLLTRRIYLMMDWADYNTGKFSSGYIWRERFVPEDVTTYPDLPSLAPDDWAALEDASRSNSDFTLFVDVQQAYKVMRMSRDDSSVTLAAQFMALTASIPSVIRDALIAEIDMENRVWNVPRAHNRKSRQDFTVPLATAARAIVTKTDALDRHNSDVLFPSETGEAITNADLNNLFARLNLDIKPMHFRAAFTMWCEEVGVDDALVGQVCGHKQPEPLVLVTKPDTSKEQAKLMRAWANFLAGKLAPSSHWSQR